MIADCVMDLTDTVALVSADSDLVPPLEFIQKQYPSTLLSTKNRQVLFEIIEL